MDNENAVTELRVPVYKSPGPTIDRFWLCDDPVQAIMGPVGGGKTSALFMKSLIRLAREQRPSPIDGFRRFKLCVVHQTYRRLWKNTIPSWWDWVPKKAGQWVGADGQPATHTIAMQPDNDYPILFIVDFIAIGDQAAEDVLRGYQPTAFLFNEADRLVYDAYDYAIDRHGRYPPVRHGGPTWSGLLLDYNAPIIGHWLYDLFEREKPAGHVLFKQPSGLSPEAENLENLPGGRAYYEREGGSKHRRRRMVENRYGFDRSGKPVHPEYNDDVHCAPEDLEPVEGIRLIIGLDAGGTPAGTIWQRLPNGQWRGYAEIVTKNSETCGPRRFAGMLNRLLKARFPLWAQGEYPIDVYADPSAAYGADRQDEDDKAWIEIVAEVTGLRVMPAPTNQLTPRLETLSAENGPLERMIDGSIPAFIISPCMVTYRMGVNGMYRYRRIMVDGGRYQDTPDKNEHSHVVESGHYAMLGGGEYDNVMGRKKKRETGYRQTQAIDEDCPDGVFERLTPTSGPRRQMYAD